MEMLSSLPLIFIPGIKGSVLRNGRGKKVWITLPQGLGLKTPNIRLPLTWKPNEDPKGHVKWIQDKDDIVATEVLKGVGPNNYYAKFLKKAEQTGRPFYGYAYDWRRELNEATANFVDFCREIGKKHSSKVQVVSHSMGGLITMAALNDPENVDLFHSVLFAGVPFTQGIGFLEDKHVSPPQGYNKKIMGIRVMASFPSPLCFFPFQNNPKIFVYKDQLPPELRDSTSYKRADQVVHDGLNEADIQTLRTLLVEHPEIQVYDLDLFSPEHWKSQKLGVFSLTNRPSDWKIPGITTEEQLDELLMNHLKIAMELTSHFRTRIEFREDVKYPPIATLFGNSHECTTRILKNGPKSVRGLDFETLPKEKGDKRVTQIASKPAIGVPHKEFESKNEHGSLLDDPITWDILKELLSSDWKITDPRVARKQETKTDSDPVILSTSSNKEEVAAQ